MKTRRAILFAMLAALILLPATVFAGGQEEAAPADDGPVSFQLWTQEGESEGTYQWIVDLADRFMTANPDIEITVVQKETEGLREDFQTASLAGEAPELLWTVSDHAGPFTIAGLIQPVDGLYDTDAFVESVVIDGQTWGVPINAGNHLMLLYNRQLVSEPPADTDEMIEIAQSLTDGETYGLVYNDTEPFWLVPWLGGFGGRVFAADGVTPNLNTPEMIATLQFLYDLEYVHGIVPAEADYGTMDTLFKEGNAAMIVNGDWSLADYQAALGADLGVAPLPRVSSTGLYPAPYTSGKYFMIADGVSGATLEAIGQFIEFVTSEEIQTEMFEDFSRLPALLSVLDSDVVAADPILAGSSAQLAQGTPMPSVAEMRANWDAMKPEQIAVLAGTKTPEEAAVAMQAAAEAGVQMMQ